MEEWKEYKLKDVATLTTGFPFDGHKYTKDGIRVVRGDNVTIGSLRWDSDKDKRWAEPFERSTEYSLHAEDIVIGMDGSRVGKNRAQVKKEDLPLLIAQRVACVRHNELSLQKYLYYQIFSDSFEQYIKAIQTGTSIPHVSLKQIGDFPIVLPSISKQKRIAEILSSLDKKIEINRRINDNLEQQAQALFKSWFVDFEPFRDQPFVESELGMIPEGWKAGSLEDITTQKAERVGGREDVKVLSPVTTGQLMLSEEYFTKQVFSESIAKYKVVEKGDFAYNPARVNIGSLGRNNYDFDGCVSPVYVVFSCKDGYAHLFDLYRKTEKFKTEVNLRAIGGVRQSLNYKDFAFIQCIIPPLYVVEEFNAIYDHLLVMQRHTGEECDRLAQLRDTLLPRLMTGELKVNEIENAI